MGNSIRFLLWPWARGSLNTWQRGRLEDRLKGYFFSLLGIGFWLVLFVISIIFFGKLAEQQPFGQILTEKLTGFVFMTFFAVLIFSNVVTSLNTFFLSDDLYILFSSPVPFRNIYLARYTQTMILSSWMVLFFASPIFIANGIVFEAPWFYYPWMGVVLLAFLLFPCAIASIITMLLVKAFPARKALDVLILVAIIFVVVLYFLFRFIRPEQLFQQDIFHGFSEYFATLQTPHSALIPTTWASEAINNGFSLSKIRRDGLFYMMMMISNGLFFTLIGTILAERLYLSAYSKSQEGQNNRLTSIPFVADAAKKLWSLFGEKGKDQTGVLSPGKQLIVKDIKTFFRETTQWTQLFLLLALVVVYVFNIKALQLERIAGITSHLRDVIALVNLVIVGFLIAAVSVRFVLTSVSVEGRAFWIIRTAPIRISKFLWTKWAFSLAPIFIISEFLIVLSNAYLRTSTFVGIATAITMGFMSLAIVSLATGVGAIYPQFEEKNVARMAASSAAIIYMVIAALFVLIETAIMFYPLRIWQIHLANHTSLNLIEWGISATALAMALLIWIMAVMLPMQLGVASLEGIEK